MIVCVRCACPFLVQTVRSVFEFVMKIKVKTTYILHKSIYTVTIDSPGVAPGP